MASTFGVLATLILSAAPTAPPDPAPLWGDLQPGGHAVGFRVIWSRDHTRTWSAADASDAAPRPGESARPLRISVWYPARRPAEGTPMPFEGYVRVLAPKDFEEFNQRVEAAEIGANGKGLRGLFRSTQAFRDFLQVPTAARLNAPPAEGSFPLVIYSPGQNDYTQDNCVLAEFLASHGFVVATVPHLGTSPRRFQLFIHDPLSYEAQVRDLEYAAQLLRGVAPADARRPVAMGHSMGGVYALLLAMRNPSVAGVIGLDASFTAKMSPYAYKYWEAPYFDAAKMRVPLVQLYRRSDDVTLDLVKGLRYSDRTLVRFDELVHADFNSYPMMTRTAPPAELDAFALGARNQTQAARGHEAVCRYALAFLRATLDGRAQEFRALTEHPARAGAAKGSVRIETFAGMKAPGEEELCTILRKQGLEAAVAAYRKARAAYPDQAIIRESTLNRIGYEYIWMDQPGEAVKVFELNVEAHPRSAAAHDSLGEAYQVLDRREQSIKSFRKSLELDPKNRNAAERLKDLEKR